MTKDSNFTLFIIITLDIVNLILDIKAQIPLNYREWNSVSY